jgi:toxin ParE1/3/4
MSRPVVIRITPRAVDDLNSICTYIEKDSPQNAAVVARRLLDAIDSLERFPTRFKVYQNRQNPARAVHAMSVHPFIVYYRVSKSRDRVDVLTILHGRRRQPRRFS